MERDSRYGAFLMLAILFAGVFFASHFAQYGVNRGAVQIPPAPPFSKRGVASLSPSAQSNKPAVSASVQAYPITDLRQQADFPGFPVDINTADADELMKVPGIGPKTARNIIEKRAQMGGFSSLNQLTEVQRIGRVRLDRFRRYITVKTVRPVEG